MIKGDKTFITVTPCLCDDDDEQNANFVVKNAIVSHYINFELVKDQSNVSIETSEKVHNGVVTYYELNLCGTSWFIVDSSGVTIEYQKFCFICNGGENGYVMEHHANNLTSFGIR
ncbi:hypothetical protein BLOT_002724 [Blomia tropicalis]|nr:hypothetical protein BLOT_002724 [Blomia tropicalis]